jgi:hypothetical protein
MKLGRYTITLICIMVCGSSLTAVAQDVNELFFDEATVSFNRTNVADDNTENRNGFGVGLYHSFLPQKRINLVFGLEYNRTGQFKKTMYEGHYANSTDLEYNVNSFSIPFGIRLNIGGYVKFFLEGGAYGDIVILSKRTGMMHTWYPVNNQPDYKDFPIDEKAGLHNSIGAYGAAGLRIPLAHVELIIKPEYRYGLSALYSYMDDIYNHYWLISVGVKMK